MQQNFPFIRFFAKRGRQVSWIGGLAIAAVMCLVVQRSNGPGWGYGLAIATGLAVFVVFRLGAELLELVSDTLLPQ